MPKVNWNEVEEKDFSPIPEGRYDVVIDQVVSTAEDADGDTVALTTKDGDEMWKVRFSIVGEKYANRKLFTNLVFNEGGLGNVKKLYAAIFGAKLPKNCLPSDIEDEKISVDVVVGEYRGKANNSIPYAGFYSADGEDGEFS